MRFGDRLGRSRFIKEGCLSTSEPSRKNIENRPAGRNLPTLLVDRLQDSRLDIAPYALAPADFDRPRVRLLCLTMACNGRANSHSSAWGMEHSETELSQYA